ncbi:MAG: hypothetical protein FWD34_07790, partial [Oscillospiraceae bacterium]|nr:hypothetical protein [Oscillospiraceae bacterium]
AAAGSAYTTAETQYDSVNKAWIKQNEDAWTDWNVYETEPFTIWQAQLQAERLAEIKANPKPGTNNQFNTLANIESDIYTKESIGKSPQCPWYAYGRTNEVTGMKLEFDGLRHGGWWVKNVKENDYVMPISDERKYDPDFIRAPSVASFLFEVDASDGDIDFYGHVVFIEAVEHTPDGVFIYYSESNTGKGIGTITKIEFESFTKMYDKKTAYPGEDIYQGFILLN